MFFNACFLKFAQTEKIYLGISPCSFPEFIFQKCYVIQFIDLKK